MLHKFPINRPLGDRRLEQPKGGRVFTPETDTLFLLWLSGLTGGNIVEIGANAGLTTYHLAVSNPTKIIYAIEPEAGGVSKVPAVQMDEVPTEPFRWCKDLPNVKPLAIPSGDLDYAKLDDVTLVFIDGDHSYEGVKADSTKALEYLRRSSSPNRFIVWHDYTPNPHLWLGVGAYLHWDLWNKLEIYHVTGTAVAFAQL